MAVGLAGAGIAAAVLLALGGSGSLRAPEFAPRSSGVGDPPYTGSLTPSCQEEAARAQALLSRSTLEIGIDIQANRDLVAYQLAQTIGPGVKLPDLDAQGFRFVRAQLLRSESEPLAQILYLRATGAPLALYAKAGEGGETPVFKRYGTIGGATWSEGGVAYLLAGDADEADMMRLAGTIKSKPLPDATRDAGEAAGAASAAHPPLTEPPTVKAKP
jgi:anti-sigma factor RsiW